MRTQNYSKNFAGGGKRKKSRKLEYSDPDNINDSRKPTTDSFRHGNFNNLLLVYVKFLQEIELKTVDTGHRNQAL